MRKERRQSAAPWTFPSEVASTMPNRLADETSPYLLQHANNPVDWFPWGDEALQLAKSQDRPIFLSIGYSACHWCLVMEHESFENPEIAELMNQWYVCIKVDREERPDLDQIYMSAVTAMTGSGGWPMSVFLTPERKPFFGGTYWPPTARWNRPGFREILTGVHNAWANRREDVHEQANQLTDHVASVASPRMPESPLDVELLQNAIRSLLRSADRENGGFGDAPKFPHPMDLRLLLRGAKRFGGTAPGDESLDVAILTLDKMARGGIYDHLGGGFARYSTDDHWLVPHFEKMLYDNALLVPAYLEAWQITGRDDFRQVARETLDYVLREMTQPEGAFYSTQDADSEGVEGKFFVWSEAEIDTLLGPDADIFKRCYDVSRQGNWEHANILNRPRTLKESAAALGISSEQLETTLKSCRQRLFNVRSNRVWPGRDDKVLVSWNGLMISAMATGALVLGEEKYAQAARLAADFILNRMRAADGRLLHSYKDGRARFNAYLDDYAALINGLCHLYQAVNDAAYLDAALELSQRMLDQFWDDLADGFFYTSTDHESLIARTKDLHDNATPSGNSLAATALITLSRLTGRPELEERAVRTLTMMSGQLHRIPMACGQSFIALDLLLGPGYELVVAPGSERGAAEQLATMLNYRFLPGVVIHRLSHGDEARELAESVRSVLAGKVAKEGQPTLFVCQNGACQAPAVGLAKIEAQLQRL